MDLARKDMERVGAKEGDEVDREKWKILSRCSDPEQGEAERRRRRRLLDRAQLFFAQTKTSFPRTTFQKLSFVWGLK